MYDVLNTIAVLAFIISIIALIRPLPSLKLPNRTRALLTLIATLIFTVAIQQLKPPPSPEELALIEKQEQEKEQREQQEQIERQKKEQEREKERQKRKEQEEKERLARTQPSGITFKEVHSKFGINSPLTDLQKKKEWDKYESKCIQWRGTLAHLDEGMFGGIVIGFKHLSSTLTYDVLVSAPASMEEKFMKMKQGHVYSYTGKLDDYGNILPIQVDWGCE